MRLLLSAKRSLQLLTQVCQTKIRAKGGFYSNKLLLTFYLKRSPWEKWACEQKISESQSSRKKRHASSSGQLSRKDKHSPFTAHQMPGQSCVVRCCNDYTASNTSMFAVMLFNLNKNMYFAHVCQEWGSGGQATVILLRMVPNVWIELI